MYGIKTADNTGLHKVIDADLPVGVDPSRVWPVDPTVPDGATRIGWRLDNGVVVAKLRVESAKPTYDPATEKLVAESAKDATGEQITWTAVALSAEEIKAKVIEAEAVAIAENVDDPKGDPGTIEDRLARAEKAIAFLMGRFV